MHFSETTAGIDSATGLPSRSQPRHAEQAYTRPGASWYNRLLPQLPDNTTEMLSAQTSVAMTKRQYAFVTVMAVVHVGYLLFLLSMMPTAALTPFVQLSVLFFGEPATTSQAALFIQGVLFALFATFLVMDGLRSKGLGASLSYEPTTRFIIGAEKWSITEVVRAATLYTFSAWSVYLVPLIALPIIITKVIVLFWVYLDVFDVRQSQHEAITAARHIASLHTRIAMLLLALPCLWVAGVLMGIIH